MGCAWGGGWVKRGGGGVACLSLLGRMGPGMQLQGAHLLVVHAAQVCGSSVQAPGSTGLVS